MSKRVHISKKGAYVKKGCICDKRVPMFKKGAYVKKGCICTSREGSDVRGWFICPRESSNVTEGFKC